MESDYGYTWQSMKGGGYKTEPVMKRYGWWISLALLLSALIHVVLFLVAEHLPPMMKFLPGQSEMMHLNTDRETLSVDEQTMRELFREEQPVPEIKEPTREEMVIEEDMFEDEPEVELATIKLTPEVTDMQNYLAGERALQPMALESPAVTDKIDIDFSSSTDASAIKNQLLEASRASVHQPTIELTPGDTTSEGVDTDAVVQELTSNLGTSDGKRITDRFTSLEALLGSGGTMPDNPEFLLPTDLLFGFNEFELKEEARLSLMKLGVVITHYPDATFKIKGFTDSIGSQDFNLELSQKRAESVRDWIVGSLNLGNYKIEAVGYGKLNPLVDPTGDKDQEKLNRRVEIEIINKP